MICVAVETSYGRGQGALHIAVWNGPKHVKRLVTGQVMIIGPLSRASFDEALDIADLVVRSEVNPATEARSGGRGTWYLAWYRT
jgi:hypothetical protein